MKIGSLVECVNSSYYEGLIKLNVIYTITDIWAKDKFLCVYKGERHYTKCACIFLAEVTTKGSLHPSIDCPFNINDFRELQPPIANIEEHIKENTLTPELI
jgi:hypothetical protein